eukprot:gb/GECG01010325.1/.p1 GENE.gb/GECG01010325.1/~~gb/GECG01010325.1/.p1  ORF type:complete len:105 (+),score=7.74 gb/GECG01010325.1/:1-315(+)
MCPHPSIEYGKKTDNPNTCILEKTKRAVDLFGGLTDKMRNSIGIYGILFTVLGLLGLSDSFFSSTCTSQRTIPYQYTGYSVLLFYCASNVATVRREEKWLQQKH